MATGLDRLVGFGMVAHGAIIFLYYTTWVVILPFVDADHIIHQLFLPRIFAVVLPIAAGLGLIAVLGVVAGVLLMKSKKPKKQINGKS